MKKTLVVASILAGAAGAYAQGQIDWNDGQRGFLISIFSPNPGNPLVEEAGNTAYDVPSDGTTYPGGFIGNTGSAPAGVGTTPANGPGNYNYQLNGNFEVGLYLATSQAALTTDILTGAPLATLGIQGGVNAGQYITALTTYSDPSLEAGTQVFVGIAAWYDVGTSSYEAAVAGREPNGYIESTSTVALGAPGSPAGLAGLGLTSFSLLVVPEPGTLALGVIGASVFLMRLRRKQ
jgi:hypothetical protein